MTPLRAAALLFAACVVFMRCGLSTAELSSDELSGSGQTLQVQQKGGGGEGGGGTTTTCTTRPDGTTVCQRDGGEQVPDAGRPVCQPNIPVHVHLPPLSVSGQASAGTLFGVPTFNVTPQGGTLSLSIQGDPGFVDHQAEVDEATLLEDTLKRFGGIQWRYQVDESTRFTVRNRSSDLSFNLPSFRSMPDTCIDTADGQTCFTNVVGTKFRYQADLTFEVLKTSGGGTHPFETSIYSGAFHSISVPISGSVQAGQDPEGNTRVFQTILDSSQVGFVLDVGVRTKVGRMFVGADLCASYDLITEQADIGISIGGVLRF